MLFQSLRHHKNVYLEITELCTAIPGIISRAKFYHGIWDKHIVISITESLRRKVQQI